MKIYFERLLKPKLSIAQTIFMLYGILILTGSLLLSLPFMTISNQATPWIDALFTATSAVCVTGQAVLNTANHWNSWGKFVIIVLIQIGGVGFMTLWAILFVILKQKTSVKKLNVLRSELNVTPRLNIRQLVIFILVFVFAVELLGAVILSTQFIPIYGVKQGIAYALFHSISAFCNAGFDLFGDSLISYQSNKVVLLTIAGLIVFGGTTFIVWKDLWNYRKKKHLMLQTKIIFIATGVLLLGGWILFGLQEWLAGTFDHLSWGNQLTNALFLSVTPRTAGFSSVDYAHISPSSRVLTMIFMFMGGSPGATSGGIKVTTLVVILAFLFSGLEEKQTIIFNRNIPSRQVREAIYILLAGFMVITLGVYVMTWVEPFTLEALLFEAFSCFGTVGLTLGITPMLHVVSKCVLIILMFLGRIGIVTFFWLFTEKPSHSIQYPEESIMIG